ncbi:MAG: tetratricopeptide repeat protein, partial [Prevotella sp.]|nr:tetratricopeptide repeat protein [Prevotella sp.]
STQYLSDDIEDAITSSEYSLAINPNDEEAILNKANGLYKLGNYEDAIDYYKRFVRIRPDEESGEMMIGISLIALNRVQEGVEYLKKAEKKISIDSTHNDEIYQELVIALSKLNRFDEALAYIKRSESAECEHNEMKVLEGFVLMKKDDLEGGRECYQQALTDSGYSPVIYLKIGMALYENHLYSAAYMTTKSLLNICPDEMSEAYAYHALFCYFVRKDDEYLEYRKIAFEKDPKLAEMVLGEIRL